MLTWAIRRRPEQSLIRSSILAVVLVLGLAASVSGVAGHAVARPTCSGRTRSRVADPDGRGSARSTIDVADREVCFDIRFDGAGTPNRGHIHSGAAGINGGIVVAVLRPQSARTANRRGHETSSGTTPCVGCVTAAPDAPAADRREPGCVLRQPPQRPLPGRSVRGQLARRRQRLTAVRPGGVQVPVRGGLERLRLDGRERTQRGAHVGSDRHAAPTEHCLAAAMNWPLASIAARRSRRRDMAGASAGVEGRAHDVRECRRHAGHGADRAASQPAGDQRLAPDQDRQPELEVWLDRARTATR